ncbi:MAG: phage integrase N-terminal SAM-like domain-containing protein [Deltaproteobacteria bacterium]|nr:phage integrase N-terminal SAM-like domain-containing protein [Deltaproteobacteria bacterium]
MEPERLEKILTGFSAFLQAEKGLTPATVFSYGQAAADFCALAARHPGQLYLPSPWEPNQLDRRAVEIYLDHLKRDLGLKPATVAYHVTVLRAFFSYLTHEGYLPANPLRTLLPAHPTHTPPPPQGDKDAVQKLLAPPGGSLPQARLNLLVELLYGCGLKPSQAYHLSAVEVCAEGAELEVHLGEQTLRLPLSVEGRQRVEDYLALREQLGQGPFWISPRGRGLTPGALGRQVQVAMEAVGLEGGPATLRRLGARHFQQGGADVRSVQAFLGQKGLGGLDAYHATAFPRVAAQIQAAHPRWNAPEDEP